MENIIVGRIWTDQWGFHVIDDSGWTPAADSLESEVDLAIGRINIFIGMVSAIEHTVDGAEDGSTAGAATIVQFDGEESVGNTLDS